MFIVETFLLLTCDEHYRKKSLVIYAVCIVFCCSIQIWVYGNSFESFLIAVANPNKLALERWASENGIEGDFDSLCEDKRAKDYLLGELNRIAKEKKVLFLCCRSLFIE